MGADVAALVAAGYAVGRPVRAFLEEFTGLTIRSRQASELWIDGVRAAGDASREWCEAYSASVGRRLTPVGIFKSVLTVMVDDEGDVWGGFDDDYGLLGAGGRELVSALFVDDRGHLDRLVEAE